MVTFTKFITKEINPALCIRLNYFLTIDAVSKLVKDFSTATVLKNNEKHICCEETVLWIYGLLVKNKGWQIWPENPKHFPQKRRRIRRRKNKNKKQKQKQTNNKKNKNKNKKPKQNKKKKTL